MRKTATAVKNPLYTYIKSRMGWMEYVACMEDRRGAYRVSVGNLRERNHIEDISVDGRIKLKRIMMKWDEGVWNGLIWLRIGTGGWFL